MNILHLGKYYPPEPGGMETFLRSLCLEQARRGHRVLAICHGRLKERRPNYARDADVELAFATTWGGSSASAVAPHYASLLRQARRTFKPDVISLHLPNLSGMVSVLALGVPFIVHWHAPVTVTDLGPKARVLLPLYRILESLTLKKALLLVVTGSAMRDDCPELAAHRNKCRVVPLGIDMLPDNTASETPANSFTRCGRSVGDKDTPGVAHLPVVLSLGRFAAYKGFDRLVRTAALVPDACFVMAGDGPLLETTKLLARDLGLAHRISFPGRVDDATRDALYEACDLFCLPSVSPGEAFGLVLLEAMAHGKPVAASCPPYSGVKDVVEHGITGILVPPDDPLSLAKAIRTLLADPGRGKVMGLAGLRRVHRFYDIRAVAGLIEQVYVESCTG